MLLLSVVVSGTGGPWELEFNEGMTIWHLAAVACLGSCSSHNNTGLAVVACHGSSSNSSNGVAAVVFISTNVIASMSFLPPDRRNSSNR